MRGVMMMGACSAALLGLAAPAAAVEPAAQPAGPGASKGPADDALLPGVAAPGPNGQMVVMTLSKPRPNPQPKSVADPAELRRHAPAGRPSGSSN
jgi:hypothetical protein